MNGNNPQEFRVVDGKKTSGFLRWTIGLFIFTLWGGICAYVGFMAAQTVLTKTAVEDLDNVTFVEDSIDEYTVLLDE